MTGVSGGHMRARGCGGGRGCMFDYADPCGKAGGETRG